jgi:hypothetical protein
MNNTINLNLEVAAAMKAIAASNPPNWIRSLKSYRNGWVAAIGANIIDKDEFGPTVVSWCGHTYTRRYGSNKQYGAAIWFSRANGKNAAGENNYVRLITFKKDVVPTAEPLPDYIKEALR